MNHLSSSSPLPPAFYAFTKFSFLSSLTPVTLVRKKPALIIRFIAGFINTFGLGKATIYLFSTLHFEPASIE
jgi:hypothetical protein